ncbi:hypothetical protein HC031_09760 [Planosporangium thailandense]|uniref:Transposase n=1 Tax=Planosporangium thailandense TaxID=765197 RepID=A0ABX0XW14_9ACTN|nr:hypothetical protein [Planosporangium thailandense]NJC69993.1 hypothetical protein [Planosporangium thailandense]
MSIKKARAALSHSVFTGISRNHLDRLVAELAEPFHTAREGRLHPRRGGRDRQRWPGAGHPETLTLRDRLLCTLAWLRLGLPHPLDFGVANGGPCARQLKISRTRRQAGTGLRALLMWAAAVWVLTCESSPPTPRDVR